MKNSNSNNKSAVVCTVCILSFIGISLLADGASHLQDTDAYILSSINIKVPYSGSVEVVTGFLSFFVVLCCMNRAMQPHHTEQKQFKTTIADIEYSRMENGS